MKLIDLLGEAMIAPEMKATNAEEAIDEAGLCVCGRGIHARCRGYEAR